MPRLERQAVGREAQGGLLNDLKALPVAFGILDTSRHPGLHRLVFVARKQVLGNCPHQREAAVERAHAPGQVGDEDAIRGGFERGLQLGHRLLEPGFGADLRSPVDQDHHAKLAAVRERHRADAAPDMQGRPIRAMHHRLGQQRLRRAFDGFRPVRHVLWRMQQLVRARAEHLLARSPQKCQTRLVDRHHLASRQRGDPRRIRDRLDQDLPGHHWRASPIARGDGQVRLGSHFPVPSTGAAGMASKK